MAYDQTCPECGEEKSWDADFEEGVMNCPDCDYSRPIKSSDL